MEIHEDNQAVLKLCRKGRSLQLRHLPRTHGIALDWMFERLQIDHFIKMQYVKTTHQLGDIFTKGRFTVGQWRHLCARNGICKETPTAKDIKTTKHV